MTFFSAWRTINVQFLEDDFCQWFCFLYKSMFLNDFIFLACILLVINQTKYFSNFFIDVRKVNATTGQRRPSQIRFTTS